MIVDKLIALGVISVLDLEDVGKDPLVKELGIDESIAEKLVEMAVTEAKKIAAEPKQALNYLDQPEKKDG